MAKTQATKPSPAQILGTASAFRIGAHRCGEMRPTGAGKAEYPLAVHAALMAFTTELSLKALILHHTGQEERKIAGGKAFGLPVRTLVTIMESVYAVGEETIGRAP